MEKLNRGTATFIGAFVLCGFLTSLIFLLWKPVWDQAVEDTSKYRIAVENSKELLSRKQTLELEWNNRKNDLREGGVPDELLNSWMKDIFAYAQAQSLKIDKMEPAGAKQGEGKKEPMLFLTFQADIKQWTAFLYYLLESDSMAKIESVSLRQDEDSKRLSIELILGKVVL